MREQRRMREIHDLIIQDGIPWILTEMRCEKDGDKRKITYRWEDYRKNLLRCLVTTKVNGYRLLDDLVDIEWEKDRFDIVYQSSEGTTR